jgi:small subunit ribosomal protein S1
LHINDLSWGRTNHPSEVVKLDERIKVVVLDFNEAKDRISLGMKQLQAHPWENVETKYPVGSVIKGKVVSIADYGAFVELEKGVEGLIHVSEMSWTRNVVHPSKLLNVGDQIEVKVLSLEKERKRISLGMKQLTPDPWDQIDVKYPVNTRVRGRVRNLTNFGAFVEMEDGIDGLIHISDLSWTKKIKHPSEILKKGQDIEVMVLDVNKSERRLSLGYKQLTDDPWSAFEEAYKVDTVTPAKVVRFIEKGMVVEMPLGVEGFVPLSQLPEGSMAKVSQTTKEGDEVQLVVIEFDRDNKRVVLSKKRLLDQEKQKKVQDEKVDVEAYLAKNEAAPTLGEITATKAADADEKKASKKKAAKKPEGAPEDSASADSGGAAPEEPQPEIPPQE